MPTMSPADIEELSRLRAENASLKATATRVNRLTLKVSLKGAVSLYGMGRFPVTLYGEQWTRLIAHGPAITSFLAANAGQLKTKA
jgi:hypothetical protein